MLQSYRNKLHDYILKDLKKNDFHKELKYAFEHGKYLRGCITFSISNKDNLALCVEYIHNASLIIDDLPCMDNDLYRRGHQTLHVKYGESTAKLISYNLIIRAYKQLHDYLPHLHDELKTLVTEQTSLAMLKLINGQYKDLIYHKYIIEDEDLLTERMRKVKIVKILEEKTGELFSLAFFLGYIGGIIDRTKVEKNYIKVKKAGLCFGLCYQIIDDLRDVKKDKDSDSCNITTVFKKNDLIDLFTDNINIFRKLSIKTQIHNELLEELYIYLITEFRNNIKNYDA